MKKPEKRKLAKDAPYAYLQYDKGYNHCWYEYEKFLPSKNEILLIISEHHTGNVKEGKKIAEVIYKRMVE